MKLGSLIKSVLASTALWTLADIAVAAPTCKYLTGATNGTVPLQVSAITVGRNVAIGSEVYRQSFKIAPNKAPKVSCTYDASFQIKGTFQVGSLAKKANWSGGKYANQVYETNIDGLGVAIVSRYGVLPASFSARIEEVAGDGSTCPRSGICNFHYDGISGGVNAGYMSYDLVFIKIGDVKPGRLQGASIPTMIMSVQFDNIPMRGLTINMEGGIDIVSRTCSTPDVVVPMGTHLTTVFANQGSASDWKDVPIALINCPAFHGMYTSNAPGWISQGGQNAGGKGVTGTADKNDLAFRIDPVRTVINTSRGAVLSLDPSVGGGAPAASGVGVQIATKDGVTLPLRREVSSGVSLQPREGSYTILLRARYLRTSTQQVTPGPANASATFTIIYR